ncbi:MAG: transporter substrate-binding domain-containing protein [Pseudomonadota bacterium]
MYWSRSSSRTLLLSLGLTVCGFTMVHAACSRVIQAPMSVIGQSVFVDGDSMSGIYPDLLRGLSDKEGCTFAMSEVPRARLEVLFETGRADVLIPASKTPKRDAVGTFIALVHNRAALLSLQSRRPTIKTTRELLEQTGLKVALVRGFDYGPVYQELVTALTKQGRVILEVDALSVARLLKAGTADLTIMASTILAGAAQSDDRVRDMLDKLRVEPLEELPWGDSGVYISNTALNPQDKATLLEALERAARSGEVWKGFQRYYSPAILKGSIRPL